LHKLDTVVVTKEDPTTYLWHKRLGNMNKRGLKILSEQKFLPGIKGIEFKFANIVLWVDKNSYNL
jgi:hypothetical protein